MRTKKHKKSPKKVWYFKFDIAAWIVDTRILTDTEKAVWIDLLAFMWKNTKDRGRWRGDWNDLSRMLGRDRLMLSCTVTSLKNKGICTVTEYPGEVVFIESSRMVNEAKSLTIKSNQNKRAYQNSVGDSVGDSAEHIHSYSYSNTKDKDMAELAFEKFWNAYPKKVAKVAAKKAYLKLAPDSDLEAQILKVISALVKTEGWIKDNGQYIPHASTFLNQRRFEDELALATRPEVVL